MMRDLREVVGFLLFHALVVCPGVALLYWAGLLRLTSRCTVAAAGPAFLLGCVTVGVPLVMLLAAGTSPGTPLILLLVAIATLVFGAAGRRSPLRRASSPGGDAEPEAKMERTLMRVVLGALGIYFLVGGLAFYDLPTAWDDANIWSVKALTLYYHAGLSPGVFRNPSFSFVHLDYPLLQPVIESGLFRALGTPDLRLWHLELWVIFAAALWTITWLLAPLGRRWLWVFVPATLAVSPVVIGNITLGDADTTAAMLVACGALTVGLWLQGGNSAHAAVGAIFLSGAANVKNEGVTFTASVLVAAALVVLVAGLRERRRALAAIIAVVVCAALPWQIWVAANPTAQRGTTTPWYALTHPGFLAHRTDLLWRGLEQTILQVTTTSAWGLLTPAFIVAAVVLLASRHARPLASFYLVAWLLGVCWITYAYAATPIADLEGFKQRTAGRIVLGLIAITAAGLAQMLQLTASRWSKEAPGQV